MDHHRPNQRKDASPISASPASGRATTTTPQYKQTKVFAITDRPVYRPMQKVKFKFWVRHAKYDQEDTSSFANQSFTVEIHNPKGEKVLTKAFYGRRLRRL